jgi:hypothetical protein
MAARGSAPKVSRPLMGGYGVPASLKGAVAWRTAERRFASAHNYWVTTVHPEGRPNSTAVWGVWLGGKFWFSCWTGSRKGRNLALNPACTVTTENGDEAVILEGTAMPVRGRAKLLPMVRAYKKKYDWTMDPDAEGYYVLTPRVGFAFVEHADQFGASATRYRFASSKPRARKARRRD